MKKAIFITSKEEIKYNLEEYGEKAAINKVGVEFNSPALVLPEGIGLLCFRKKFSVSKGIDKAVVRATALGVYDLFLNGARVGSVTADGIAYDEMKPEWTDYKYRVLEQEYDVTKLLREENELVAVVSEGWWLGRISYGYYGRKPRAFCAEVELLFDDNTNETVSSDTDWEACHGGRIRTASIWDGEYYDATYPDAVTESDAYEWKKAVKADYADMRIEKHPGNPVRIRKGLDVTPKSATVYNGVEDNGSDFGKIRICSKRIGAGCEAGILRAEETLLLDMSQETVGRPEIKIKANKGTKLTVCFAELLNDSGCAERGNDGPEGSAYLKNYRSALSRLVYVAGGSGVETYVPTHTFYGYRYLSIKADGEVEILSVTGKVVGTEMNETGTLETSSSELNKLYSNILWGMRSNYLSVPTDCPQRDERLGWAGDTQVFIGAASYMADTGNFMRKWMADVRCSQIGFDGRFAHIVPRIFYERSHALSACAWTDAGIIVPYKIWRMFRNKAILEENYDAMEAYMSSIAMDGHEGPGMVYGDWLAYEKTDLPYLSLAYYVYDISLMIKISTLLGKKDREEHYRGLHSEIVEKFTQRYVTDGEINVKTQTAYLLALAFDIVKGSVRERTVKQLRDRIRDNGYKLATGFVGTGILNQTLSKVGLDDIAYSLVMQYEDPSWLYSLRQGATTVWERWDSYTLEKGFGNVKMNSFNHYAYGAVAEWMYATMAGISPDENRGGFKHFVLRPTPDTRKKLPRGQERISYVKATYNSVDGLIESSWSYENGAVVYKFTIPEGTDARIELIDNGKDTVINGMTFTREELGAFRRRGRIVFKLGAGKYEIR